MSHNGNWFAVSRMIFDHHLVGIHDREFTELEAWLWLISEAAWEHQEVINKGRVIVIDPGQIMHARAFLATRWMWTEAKVRWFLKRLENEAMITRFIAKFHSQQRSQQNDQQHSQQPNNQVQIITLCNYADYQSLGDEPDSSQQPATHPVQQPASQPQVKTRTLKKDSPLPPKGGDGGFRIRGSRLPSDWALPTEWRVAGREAFHVTEAQITTEANSFRDYWLGVAGAKGNKADWQRTWMNWLRRKYTEKSTAAAETRWWSDKAKVAAVTRAQWQGSIAKHANGVWSVDKLGPPPGHPECIVPQSVIDELKLTEIYTAGGIAKRPH